MAGDREPIEIKDTLVDPYKITQVAREAVDRGRRITAINRTTDIIDKNASVVRLELESVTNPYPIGQIPGVDRPYRIFESLTAEDAKRLSGR